MTLGRRSLIAGAAAALPIFAVAAKARPVVGISLPLTGVQAPVAKELRSGYTAALRHVADLHVLDDESKPALSAKHMREFAGMSSVVATTGIVGTPHAKEAIPVARDGGLPVVGIRSGAAELRDGSAGVFHLRASFEDEVTKILDMASIYRNVGVLYSDDAFGRGVLAHAERVAADRRVVIGAQIAVDRNGGNLKQKVAELAERKERLGTVLLALIQNPALAAAKELRNTHQFVMPIFGMSFIATSGFSSSMDPAFDGIALASPFPLARVAIENMARAFRTTMVTDKTPELIESPTAFEGYFYGSVLADAIEHGGPSRKLITAYLSHGRPLDVKDVSIRFDAQRVGYRYLNVLRKQGATLRA